MTTQDEINWQTGGLDEPSSISTTGWRRPSEVRLDGEDLVFSWPADLELHGRVASAEPPEPLSPDQWRDTRRFLMAFGEVEVYPSRQMLFRFATLAKASSERIRRFAARYGALQEQVPRRGTWTPPAVLPDRQALAYWRLMSEIFAKALDLAARPTRTTRDDEELAWLVNGQLFQADVVDFFAVADGQPVVLHASGGLYGGLAVELLAAAARVGFKLCGGCGLEVGTGGRRFCQTCRDTGVPDRLRSRRYRAARSQPEVKPGKLE